MHDVLHGVANYVLRAVIYQFIFVNKYFTLETLNSRIQSFNFGPNKNLNKPPEIFMNHLKNKLSIKCMFRSRNAHFGSLFGNYCRRFDY